MSTTKKNRKRGRPRQRDKSVLDLPTSQFFFGSSANKLPQEQLHEPGPGTEEISQLADSAIATAPELPYLKQEVELEFPKELLELSFGLTYNSSMATDNINLPKTERSVRLNPSYWERRVRNYHNTGHGFRDARKSRVFQLRLQIAILEDENEKLRVVMEEYRNSEESYYNMLC